MLVKLKNSIFAVILTDGLFAPLSQQATASCKERQVADVGLFLQSLRARGATRLPPAALNCLRYSPMKRLKVGALKQLRSELL